MLKVIRLSESDLNRLVKKIVREQNELALVDKVTNNPQVEKAADEAVSQMSSKDIKNVKRSFSRLGVSTNSSFDEVKNAVDNLLQKVNLTTDEMTEDQEVVSKKKKLWNNVKQAMLVLGITNFAALATPFAILYKQLTDSLSGVPDAFEVSFIVSCLLVIIGGSGLLKNSEEK